MMKMKMKVMSATPAPPAPPAAPQPQPQTSPASDQKQPQQQPSQDRAGGDGKDDVDITALPNLLNDRMDKLDQDDALRPTIIKPGKQWKAKTYAGILSPATNKVLGGDKELKQETNQAYDLLDALSKGGTLPIESSDLYVFMASTHYFAQSLTETIIEENVNPIEPAERSALILAATVHGTAPAEMLTTQMRPRVEQYAQHIFEALPAPQPQE